MNSDFLILFFAYFPLTYLADCLCYYLCLIISKIIFRSNNRTYVPLISFLIFHGSILPLLTPPLGYLWWFLTVAHGVSQITHPHFLGEEINEKYTPIYKCIVRAAQCLTIWNYHPFYLPIGIFVSMTMYVSGAIAHIDTFFTESYLWTMVYVGEVFASHYHMMLLNTSMNYDIFLSSIFIWVLPYIGYLVRKMNPAWDSTMNKIGVFRMWNLHFFIIHYLMTKQYIINV